jgi:outer membrane receptor for ferrienterochelin and colicins
MRKYLAIGLFSLGFLSADGQIDIQILDAEGQGMPGAHGRYGCINAEGSAMALANTEGKMEISLPCSGKIWLEITYVGYRTMRDTFVATPATLRYKMQATDVTLNQFVVTAQYAPNSPEKAIQKIRIIDQKKIESMAAVNLRDVLTNELNIRISQDNVLGSGMSMQGISGQNVKIMIDGVPVLGRLDGNIDLQQINLNNIERIEVVEGPLSVNYGTDALAGTINLITKKTAKEKTQIHLSSYHENIGTHNLSATAAQQMGKGRISVSGGRNYFDGWNPGDAFLVLNPNLRADSTRYQQWKPREQLYLRGQMNYKWKKILIGYKGELFEEKIINRGRPRKPYFETAFDDKYTTRRHDHALMAEGALGHRFRLNAVASHNRYDRLKQTSLKNLTNLTETPSAAPGDQDTIQYTMYMSRASVASTKDSALFNYEIGYDINRESAAGARIDGQSRTQGDYAVFASSEWNLGSRWKLRPGLRLAHNTNYAAPVIPSVNLMYRKGKYTIRASWARGFRAPSIKEQYFYFVDINHNIVGNRNLHAETSHNFSASVGYKKLIKQMLCQADLQFFYNDIQDMIGLSLVQASEFSYVNIHRFQSMGTSGNIAFMWHHLKINLGSSYIGRSNQLSDSAGVAPQSWSPEFRGNLLYEFKKLKLTTALFYKYQGRQVGYRNTESGVEETFIAPYHMADATIGKKLWKDRITISGGVKNLFNLTNISATMTSGAHSGGGNSVPVATGRMAFVKLDFQWLK